MKIILLACTRDTRDQILTTLRFFKLKCLLEHDNLFEAENFNVDISSQKNNKIQTFSEKDINFYSEKTIKIEELEFLYKNNTTLIEQCRKLE